MGRNCPSCGLSNFETARFCQGCGAELSGFAPPPPPRGFGYQPQGLPPPKNYLVESILVTVFCCMPLGIAGIINAVKVENQAAMGDFAGAHASASRAKQFAVLGGVGMLVLYALIFGFAIILAIFSSSKTMQYERSPRAPYLETRSSLQEQIIEGGIDI